ncbi:hypothetical protein Cgig2_030825 [Carnegiea gigantea]|uniref:Reverse transcriptase zinc-binding domain-containing protein n=1 Tax=Carnegiea gigantea TaxID=171969 RepID=A0A9Q1JJB1_9CARY|nr:hypothetical protein Cgig2_030825 [Carnegiea gigantea]
MGIYSFWATIFIMPKSVLKEVNNRCRNFLWGADEVHKKVNDRYLWKSSWWDYQPKRDVCWQWRKTYKVKESFIDQNNMVMRQYPQTWIHSMICQEEDETQEHLFYQCNRTRKVWMDMGKWLKLSPQQSGNKLIFKEKSFDRRLITKAVQEDVIQKTLYIAKDNTKYYRFIDGLLA